MVYRIVAVSGKTCQSERVVVNGGERKGAMGYDVYFHPSREVIAC